MSVRASAVIVLSATSIAFAGIFSYEATLLPDQAGFNVLQIYCDPDLGLDQGWFIQHVELCPGDPPPGGQQASYRRSLADYIGAPTFFVEWRMETTADAEELPWGGGAALSVWSNGGVNYFSYMADTRAELNRDNTLPTVFVDIDAGMAHTYRLELVGSTSYTWFIDGQIVDSGIPEGPYPSSNPNMNFRAKAAFAANTTLWDYIRYGNIPLPNSGDFDSNGVVDQNDLYFFVDCLLGPSYDAAGPGCSWADMNADGVANGADISAFVAAMMS